MKQKIPFLLAAGIASVATAALGQDHPSGQYYVSGGMGAAFEQELRVRGADLIDFHNGVRADVAVGYQACSYFAAELATGVIWNSADKIGGVSVTSFGNSLDLYQVPVLANVIFTTPAWRGIRAYLGGGVGGDVATIDFERPLGSIHDTDLTFGYQGFAGVNCQMSKRLELGVGYKFLRSESHNWIENDVTLKTAGTGVHSVTASLTWKF